MPAHKQSDPATQRGISHALARAFNGSAELPPAHIASDVAAAEFEALLAQLNNPPDAYRRAAPSTPTAGGHCPEGEP